MGKENEDPNRHINSSANGKHNESEWSNIIPMLCTITSLNHNLEVGTSRKGIKERQLLSLSKAISEEHDLYQSNAVQ